MYKPLPLSCSFIVKKSGDAIVPIISFDTTLLFIICCSVSLPLFAYDALIAYELLKAYDALAACDALVAKLALRAYELLIATDELCAHDAVPSNDPVNDPLNEPVLYDAVKLLKLEVVTTDPVIIVTNCIAVFVGVS